MPRIIFILLAALLLSGCFWNTKTPDVNFDENFSHPELPNTVQPYKFDFKVITSENKDEYITDETVFLAIDYKESLVFRQFLEDMKRFMLEANGVICYYREELDEPFCENQKRYIERNNTEE